MTTTASREFIPGTLGWSAADLDDPAIEALWVRGQYEIVEGVLTIMPPAYFEGGAALANLIHLIKNYQEANAFKGQFSFEVDLVLSMRRVVRADAMFLTPEDSRRQQEAVLKLGRSRKRGTRILVPPTLVIESVSPGHESHDVATKSRWYAEFGIPHYWIIDPFDKTMTCLKLRDGEYQTEQTASGDETITPSLFQGLTLSLSQLWPEEP